MRRALVSIGFLLMSIASLSGQTQLPPEVYLDRTAFFVGEPILYRVRIAHDSKIEFITSRLDKANLEMAPFKVQTVTVEQGRQGELNLLSVSLQLVTYETAQKEWKIPPFNLYYISRSLPEGGPVQLLTVPAVPVAFRSSLPADSNRIRDEVTFSDFRGSFWATLSLGLLGFLVIGAVGGSLAYQRLHRPAPEREERSAIEKRASHAVNRLLEMPQPDDSPASVVGFYRDMVTVLRDYSAQRCERSGPSLTSAEIGDELIRAGEDAEQARRIAALVALGDEVRYADQGFRVGAERLEGARSELGRLFRN
jgi:hypothetical protein